MPYDGLVTRKICSELTQKIIDGKVDKIVQPGKDEVVLFIHKNRETFKLLLSANAENARTHLTSDSFVSPQKPFNFCMVLRKYLLGSKLLSIFQPNNDRILDFTFENSNELGDKEIKILTIEMMGKFSNIILMNMQKNIVDSIKHVDFEISRVREVMPGRAYELPLSNNKINPFNLTKETFDKLFEPEKNIATKLIGISSLAGKEIYSFESFSKILAYSDSPVILSNEETFSDFYICPLKNSFKNYTETDSINEAVDLIFKNKRTKTLLENEKNVLGAVVSHLLSKSEKKLKLITEKIETTKEMEELKLKGELLSSNLYNVKPYSSEIILKNYYTDEDLTIELNPNLSPAENLQRIYKKYNKLKSTLMNCTTQKEQLCNDIAYFESLFFEIYTQKSALDLEEINQELLEQNLLKSSLSKKKPPKISEPLSFTFSEFEILVGKNNIQNDKLTFHIAKKNDIWLHVKNAPGSHTIIRVNEKECPTEVLEKAAKVTAFHSKLKNSPKVDVDYTFVKNVKKIPGAKPGMVIYENYKTLYVEPDEFTF